MDGEKEHIARIIDYCDKTLVKAKDINSVLESVGSAPLRFSVKISELISRPQVSMKLLADALPDLKTVINAPANRKEEIAEEAEIKIKYKGYIDREILVAEKMHRLENIKIRGHFNYAELHEISTEGRQKLIRIDPETLAQASRIPGVSPSDINVLLILMGR